MSEEWFAAHRREKELYRRCCADPLRAQWQEYFEARKQADEIWARDKRR